MKTTSRFLALAAILLALSPSLARAQSSGPADKEAISIQGSDTMVVLGQRWAQVYMASRPGTSVSVTGGSSGTGVAALINDTCSIAQSSRKMKGEENKNFAVKFKARPLEVPVALDGLAIFVHESNPLASITLEQARGIYTGKIANFKELGGPDAPITVYGRESNSGTYATFKEMVLHGDDFAPTVNTLAGTAAVINAAAKDKAGIGYGGIGYGSGVKILPVDLGDGSEPVAPSEENVLSGRYPLARPLYFYLNPRRATAAAGAFVSWVLSEEGQALVSGAGYYPMPAEKAAETRAAVEKTLGAAPVAEAKP